MTSTADLLAELASAQPDVEPALPVGAWFDRVIASSDDRTAWLRARQRVATATEVAELTMHPASWRKSIVAKKLAPPEEIVGNRYIDRGHEREPVIAEYVAREWPAMRGNGLLLASAENPRHAATPDLLGSAVPPEGGLQLVCGDIKTSKYDLRPSRRDGYFWSTHYYGQLQWQMLVTGTRWALFIWEQHDNRWPNPEPLELEPEWEWIARDDVYIARMVAAADAMLAELDRAIAGRDAEQVEAAKVVRSGEVDAEGSHEHPVQLRDPDRDEQGRALVGAPAGHVDQEGDWHEPVPAEPDPVDEALERRRQVAGLGLAILAAREAEAEVKARKDKPWAELQLLLADSRSDTWRDGQVNVTWTNEEVSEPVADLDAALVAPVEGLDGDVTGADLKADLERARVAWEEHQARHTKVRTLSKQRLTVTPVKPPKEKKS